MPVELAERHHIAQFPEIIIYLDQLAAHPLANCPTTQPDATFMLGVKSLLLIKQAYFTCHHFLLSKTGLADIKSIGSRHAPV